MNFDELPPETKTKVLEIMRHRGWTNVDIAMGWLLAEAIAKEHQKYATAPPVRHIYTGGLKGNGRKHG